MSPKNLIIKSLMALFVLPHSMKINWQVICKKPNTNISLLKIAVIKREYITNERRRYSKANGSDIHTN